MAYNPQKHHRKSIRLKGYDYTQAGLYFVTICNQNRAHLFGHIEKGEMIFNDAGTMIGKWYVELENKFPDILCREMVIMPNHFHCIIQNVGAVGADLRVRPNNKLGEHKIKLGEHNEIKLGEHNEIKLGEHNEIKLGEHVGSPLHRVVQWFKTMTTNEYIRGVKKQDWQRFDGKLWQRNYWEHVIRNQNEYESIAEYILNNPQNWGNDKLKK